jgi:GalNAc-alpha-(1->4)-GalNAc-alpha-(1->3)-diNAcBac-PP-undecaprenol alpha-1,4-N-acetyl-D-galactosaminyltransferase
MPSEEPRRVTIVIHSISGGGAERVTTVMANHWADNGDAVTLITLDDAQPGNYAVDPKVHRVGLDVMGDSSNPLQAVWNNFSRIRKLRAAIRDSSPEIVISMTDKMNVVTLLACIGLRRRVLICERIDPRHRKMGRIWPCLRRITYPWCNRLIVQTQGVKDYAKRYTKRKPIHVIPNPITPSASKPTGSNPPKNKRYLAAMGRFDNQKGFDMLIKAWASIARKHLHWSLRLIGDGSDRETLEQLCREYQIEDRVEFSGWLADPTSALCECDLFVLSSRYEGFPMALLEAMACGLPAVSFDCKSGPAEIIRHEVDGLIIPPDDVAALTAAMHTLISDEKTREEYAQRAVEVIERFSIGKFLKRWEDVLEEASKD